jgi:hypothetical protein
MACCSDLSDKFDPAIFSKADPKSDQAPQLPEGSRDIMQQRLSFEGLVFSKEGMRFHINYRFGLRCMPVYVA